VTFAIGQDSRIQFNGFSDIFLFPLIVLTALAFSALSLSKIIAGTFWVPARGDARKRLAVALVGTLPLLVWAWGREVNEQYCRDARRWCEERVPEIELWKSEHSKYPGSLDDMQLDSKDVPRRLRREILYYGDHEGYLIGYVSDLPGDWAQTWMRGPGGAEWRPRQLGL
jgi:hypothetical protein